MYGSLAKEARIVLQDLGPVIVKAALEPDLSKLLISTYSGNRECRSHWAPWTSW